MVFFSFENFSVDFIPNKKEICSSTLSGLLYTWNVEEAQLKGTIEYKADISGGRLESDRMTSANSTKNKHFNSISISPNGAFVIGGGNSKNLCMFDIKNKLLLKKFLLTHNRSLDGVLDKLNSKNVNEFGATNEFDLDESLSEDEIKY